MQRVTEDLERHHAVCDELFAASEAAAHAADWPACEDALRRFQAGVEAHFVAEETILFPAFEAATGMADGPTAMMRYEHAQIRESMRQLAESLEHRDADGFSGAAEALLVLIGQHNVKEQNILYPMCDQSLERQSRELSAALRNELDGSRSHA